MATIGFLTPYKHLPNFCKSIKGRFKDLNLKDIKRNDIKIFQGIDYLFAAPNYLNYILEEEDIEGMNLKGIISPSTGINHINITSKPIYSIKNDSILEEITSTAEHNLFLILSLVRNSDKIEELSTKTLGILGYGRLGKMLYSICENIFKDVKISDDSYTDDDFFEKTDILSININLEDRNIDFINKDYINKFKKNILIVNTARGEVVDENDILDTITEGKVLGYGTDVIKEEHTPKATNLKITSDPRIIRTPHVGGTAISAQEKAYKRVIEKLN
jgi:lactate dehydrogenase-like 2-hydroxyacid dehydrogenase